MTATSYKVMKYNHVDKMNININQTKQQKKYPQLMTDRTQGQRQEIKLHNNVSLEQSVANQRG